MKNRHDLRTIWDASQYINERLAFAESGRYQRHEVARSIVGLGALDIYDIWERDCPELAIVYELAVTAELDEFNADKDWPKLLAAAQRLEAVAAQTS
jgi:hypothetical protein